MHGEEQLNVNKIDKMLDGKKVRDRVDDESGKSYLEYMTLQDSRIWIRIRARSIKGVKYNNKSSFKDSPKLQVLFRRHP